MKTRLPLLRQIHEQAISRRTAITTLTGMVATVAALGACGDQVATLYPNTVGQFGSSINVGKKGDFPAAKPGDFKLGQVGVFYQQIARSYVIHLHKDTKFLLSDTALKAELAAESLLQDKDGSYWLALYQRCVHLGCTVPFNDACLSFNCPCHNARYHVDGAYLSGPAPRSMDRFPLSFYRDDVLVNTGKVDRSVPSPDASTRLLPVPTVQCNTVSS